jgi:excisionase family DNA binding protein
VRVNNAKYGKILYRGEKYAIVYTMENENRAKTALRLLTSFEVADILKMNPQVIARKLQAGEIEGYKIGKDWRVSEAQLMAFLEAHSNKRAPKSAADRVVKSFFSDGKLTSIPAQRSKRLLILKHLVAKLDPARVYSEKEINVFLGQFHSDVCTLRREFIMNKLMVRKAGKYKAVSWNLLHGPSATNAASS